jgi:SRSO17 transposase
VFKPEKRRKPTDTDHSTTPQLVIALVRELVAHGFTIDVVVADSLYGASGPLVRALEELKLPYVVAMRQHYGMLLPPGQRVRPNRWRRFERPCTDGTRDVRWMREWI